MMKISHNADLCTKKTPNAKALKTRYYPSPGIRCSSLY
ncbi:hypothetical protein UYSO10_1374 [Kosakonia radicincitans]|nr:hypothetical protein UYSO10_1374 [Kosakonia radicincitans]